MFRIAAVIVFGLATSASAQAPLEYSQEDPTKIVTAEACGECHVSEYEVWKKTGHAVGFKELHRTESAEAIAKRLGFRLMKRDANCLLCHYTPTVQGTQLRAVSGVSCESCHGAAADWIDIHNDYGGKGIDHTTETPEHREMRIRQSREAGMRRPSDLYDVAANCFTCHTVPDERLVNVGKHSIGSSSFELVERLGSEIKHNFLESFKTGDGTVNADTTPEHKRRLYVTGRALQLEHAIRGVAGATEKGVYLKAMQRRVRDALTEVRAIVSRGGLSEFEPVIAQVRATKMKLGNRDGLLNLADLIRDTTKSFLNGHNGTQLASLDPLVKGTLEAGDVIAEEEPEEEEDEAVALASTPADPAAPGVTTPAAGTATADAPSTAAQPTGLPAIPAEGERRSRLRPKSKFATLAGDACQKCHGDQHNWWYDDPHYAAIEPFLERERKNTRIARLYGISPSRMARGDSLCMDCHGTIVTGREKREVQDGVSCQGCHGPAKEFFEPHQEGEKSQGLQRPGYVKALTLGMVELKKLDVRADACASCHYITDRRLLSAGHPSGIDFDYADGMKQIRHWESATKSASAIEGAVSAVLASRGAVPKVRLARLATRAPAAAATAASVAGDLVAVDDTDVETTRSYRAPGYRGRGAPRARPADRRSGRPQTATAVPINGLPPFPQIDPTTSVEEILLLLKERLELLYDAVRKEP
ncbi:MAG: multiheme c-type cytochrome [Acidobacteriota bacterium]